MHPVLKQKYAGQHVAIHEGQLVDHDEDAMTLAQRIRERFGRTPILITHVDDNPLPEYAVRRPHLLDYTSLVTTSATK
jgi:hypothetical protein